jgi:hypothetical protein
LNSSLALFVGEFDMSRQFNPELFQPLERKPEASAGSEKLFSTESLFSTPRLEFIESTSTEPSELAVLKARIQKQEQIFRSFVEAVEFKFSKIEEKWKSSQALEIHLETMKERHNALMQKYEQHLQRFRLQLDEKDLIILNQKAQLHELREEIRKLKS